MKINSILLVFVLLFYSFAPAFAEEKKTQLQIREYQTHVYNTQDIKGVMKTVIDVLQDDSYEIKNADMDLGFLTAVKDYQKVQPNKGLVTLYSFGVVVGIFDAIVTFGILSYVPIYYAALCRNEYKPKHFVMDTTINVSQFGEQSKVRAIFVLKMFGKQDGTLVGKTNRIKTTHIKDEKLYQEFFSKIDKSLALQKENL